MSDCAYGIHPPWERRRTLYIVLGFVMFLAIVVLFVDIEENSPQLCAACHTMRPEYYTWQASSHSQLGCVECHRGEGLGGQVELLSGLARMAESAVLENYVMPIRMFSSIDDQTCFKCHTYNRQATVSGDLIIPHEDHTGSRVRCASCHSGVAHGDIAKRGITRKIDPGEWDKDQGLQAMARELTQPNMDTCMSCHYRRRITTDCAACHTDMFGPDSHQLADFAVNHGSWARAELQDCNFCHGYVGPKKLVVKEDTNFIEYTRNNKFCISCHRQKPDSHQQTAFMDVHGKSITRGEKQKDGCMVCHDNNISHIPKATETTCSSCHPASHGKNWRNGHMPFVPPGQRLSYECLTCHSSTQCLSCHYLPGYSDNNGTPTIFDPDDLSFDFFM